MGGSRVGASSPAVSRPAGAPADPKARPRSLKRWLGRHAYEIAVYDVTQLTPGETGTKGG